MLACFTSAASVDERARRSAVPTAVDPRHAVGYSVEQDPRSRTSGEVQARLVEVKPLHSRGLPSAGAVHMHTCIS
jgi:hypothetical protein